MIKIPDLVFSRWCETIEHVIGHTGDVDLQNILEEMRKSSWLEQRMEEKKMEMDESTKADLEIVKKAKTITIKEFKKNDRVKLNLVTHFQTWYLKVKVRDLHPELRDAILEKCIQS